jgi:nitrate reductase delta subunit
MNPVTSHPILAALGALLEYPGAGFLARLDAARHATSGGGDAGAAFGQFATAMAALEPDAREELYTTTFDVTPACVPYVSIHLFGEENFKRGEFMAALHARYQQAGFPPAGELPDHLSVLLRFAATAGEAEGRELAGYCLLGPVSGMAAALTEANPYRALLVAVHAAVQAAHPGVEPVPSPLEQMRQHGAGCAVASAACGCGAARIQDGPGDEPDTVGTGMSLTETRAAESL